jgi:hypothetical protein
MEGGGEVSDTPRTDAAKFDLCVGYERDGSSRVEVFVECDFAQELERENAAMREQIEHLGKANSMLHLDLVDAHAETAKETRRADKAEVENAALREAIRVSLIRAYTAGYLHGHEATVEGGFIPVHRSDETEFHAESIHQMLCDGSLPELQPFLKP